jgi:5-methylcytosine-specific restriction endonuclease McrA
MKFSEFPIFGAIYDVYLDYEAKGLKPRSSNHFIYEDKRKALADAIYDRLSLKDRQKTPYDVEYFLKCWDLFGKRSKNRDTSGSNTRLVIEVARKYGYTCMYSGRFGNECNDTVNLDRISAGSEYSLGNCVISCAACNNKKRDKDLQQLIKSRKRA